MRFIYKILVGLIIFNSMLILFAGFFTIGSTQPIGSTQAQNITDDATTRDPETGETIYYKDFNIVNMIFSLDAGSTSILGVGFGLTILFGWALKSPVPIGAGFFSTFLALLYYKNYAIIETLNPGNWIISNIILLTGIMIAILAAFVIIEMFSGQTGAD